MPLVSSLHSEFYQEKPRNYRPLIAMNSICSQQPLYEDRAGELFPMMGVYIQFGVSIQVWPFLIPPSDYEFCFLNNISKSSFFNHFYPFPEYPNLSLHVILQASCQVCGNFLNPSFEIFCIHTINLASKVWSPNIWE